MQGEFNKYQRIKRLGTEEVEGIDVGRCYIFPKIDGTNASMWVEPQLHSGGVEVLEFRFGSRNRMLSLDDDNAGFMAWGISPKADNYRQLLLYNETLTLYGEWLVPHTMRTYREDAWNRFYVFDVYEDGKPLCYEDYQHLLEEYNIDYIPPINIVHDPAKEYLYSQLSLNKYLIEDGKGIGEGIVIKNYDFVNKWGRTTWAKIITSEFKDKNTKLFGGSKTDEKPVEQKIVERYITTALVEKEYAKIVNRNDGWSGKCIPMLLSIVYKCLIEEESWNFLKRYKNPTINFGDLNVMTVKKVKEIKPELF